MNYIYEIFSQNSENCKSTTLATSAKILDTSVGCNVLLKMPLRKASAVPCSANSEKSIGCQYLWGSKSDGFLRGKIYRNGLHKNFETNGHHSNW